MEDPSGKCFGEIPISATSDSSYPLGTGMPLLIRHQKQLYERDAILKEAPFLNIFHVENQAILGSNVSIQELA
jgi:hypothetical protein